MLCVVAFVCGVIGIGLLVSTRAATPMISLEAEGGTVTTPAIAVTDGSASQGKAVQFKHGSPATLLGVYDGGTGTEEDTKTRFGAYPEIASTYYQANQTSLKPAGEKARIDKGIAPLITITSKGTQYIQDIANKSGTGWTWIQSYVAALKPIGEYGALKHVPVYATFDHEYEVKVNQGLITGASADSAVYGKALSNFLALVKSQAPDIRTVYWYGHFDTVDIARVGNALTVKPDVYAFDPYSSASHSSTETLIQLVQPKINWLKAQPWYDNKPIALSEFGAKHADADMARFYTNLRPQLAQLHVEYAVLFNRDDGDIVITITNGNFPLTVQAFSDSLKSRPN